MPRKPSKPNQEIMETPFSWTSFAKDCINGQYVLVVGSEAVLNKDEKNLADANGDSSRHLFNIFLDYLKDEKGLNISNTKINNFTQLGYDMYSKDTNTNLTAVVREMLKKYTIDYFKEAFDKEFEPTLLNLLKTKCFRVVLTTTVDPYVEIAMEKVWGKGGFQILSIHDGLHKDFEKDCFKTKEFNEVIPTLYYVFGKADPDNSMNDFVLTENASMETIKKWLLDSGPSKLLSYINGTGMKIISIGCKFDDWLFRFFWYVLRGDIDNLSNGQVAIEIDDEKLLGYLDKQKIKHFEDSRLFMKQATDEIIEATNLEQWGKNKGGIFISYAHEDRYIALRLFNLLKIKFNVWIDGKKLNEGNTEYERRICEAIKECKIFLPILSSQVKRDLQKLNDQLEHEDRYYQKEWHFAQERYDNERQLDDKETNMMQILPFVTRSYNISEKYHQRTSQCIRDASVYDMGDAKNVNIDTIYDRINSLL